MALGITSIVLANRVSFATNELHELQKEVTNFSSILSAHYAWRNSLTESILADKEFSGSLDPSACALGMWMNSDTAKNLTDNEILGLLNEVKDPHDFIHQRAQNIVEILETHDKDKAITELTDTILPKFGEVIDGLSGIMERYEKLIEDHIEMILGIQETSETITIVLLIVVLVASVLLALFITNSIIKPLHRMTEAAEELALGNLEVVPEYHVNDQIGRLAESFKHLITATKQQVAVAEMLAEGDLTANLKPRSNDDTMSIALMKMLNNLNRLFKEVHAATNQVSAGAKQIADGAQSLAQGSTQQAASIEELSNSISELAQKTRSNAEIASKTTKLEESIIVNAEKGGRRMEEMMSAVQEINQASQGIGKVIRVIDDIAFQTNILALNAAVEAARAGQHGKGFAVVAEEVRNLASKSAEAAKETGTMIENSMSKAEFGTQIAEETRVSLNEILSGISESSSLIREITKASEEQSFSIDQINNSIDQVTQVIQQNSATAEEEAASSEEMSGQSVLLQQLISQFKLSSGDSHAKISSSANDSYYNF